MDLLGAVIMLINIQLVLSSCYEEMRYYQKYAYGYNITCTNLNASNIQELQSISAFNEIKLTIVDSVLESPNLFRNTRKLREMEIFRSKIVLDDETAAQFHLLKRLEVLNVTKCNLSFVSNKTFRNMDKLRILNLSNNKLKDFRNVFLNHLTVLDISKNLFEKSSSIPFCKLPNLIQLFVQENSLTEFVPVRNCTKLLQFLYLDHNKISHLNHLANLHQLEEISLSYNKLYGLTDKFSNLTNLKLLNLEGNQITRIKKEDIVDLVNLKILNLKNNSIANIDSNSFQNLIKLEELYLDYNRITEIQLDHVKKLKSLSLSGNSLKLTEGTFKNIPHLIFLSLKNCQIMKATFDHLVNLQFLDLSDNTILISNTTLSGLGNLIILDLHNNSIVELPDSGFQKTSRLRFLDLSLNSISVLNQTTFSHLKDLESLNLSYNHLRSLSENVLVSMPKLKSINLESNRLKFIEYSAIMESLPYLKTINIQQNQLSCEFLSDLFMYFKNKKISFTTNQQVFMEKENVGGIKCHEQDVNHNLNHEVVVGEFTNYGFSKRVDITIVVVILVVLILLIVTMLITYNIYVLIKRRRSSGDEIELLDRTLQKVECYST